MYKAKVEELRENNEKPKLPGSSTSPLTLSVRTKPKKSTLSTRQPQDQESQDIIIRSETKQLILLTCQLLQIQHTIFTLASSRSRAAGEAMERAHS